MNRRILHELLVMFTAVVVALVPSLVRAADTDTMFRVGVVPHTSARIILEMYQPLRESLQKNLGVPVEIVTAPNFNEYIRRALDQNYDIAITTGHQARVLEVDAGYKPLMTYKAPFRSVAIVPVESTLQGPKELAGTTVVGLGPTSLVTQWGAHWLHDAGVTDTKMRYVSAADSEAQLVLAGDASVGFMSLANYEYLAPEVRTRLRILAQSEPVLGRVYMLNARQQGRRDALIAALHTFAATPVGQQYFDQSHLEGYREVRPGEMESMDFYAQEVREALKTISRQ
ncbi:MAG: phosphate/phosphite/phosphonate ABC transporter substrate-binding protein [Alphaproteobacteria bacterium]|nr:phosphate/phosphite/phosphonate ABC transporter substrate-binding protein [Alphaproteobacteria bacterium]